MSQNQEGKVIRETIGRLLWIRLSTPASLVTLTTIPRRSAHSQGPDETWRIQQDSNLRGVSPRSFSKAQLSASQPWIRIGRQWIGFILSGHRRPQPPQHEFNHMLTGPIWWMWKESNLRTVSREDLQSPCFSLLHTHPNYKERVRVSPRLSRIRFDRTPPYHGITLAGWASRLTALV